MLLFGGDSSAIERLRENGIEREFEKWLWESVPVNKEMSEEVVKKKKLVMCELVVF